MPDAAHGHELVRIGRIQAVKLGDDWRVPHAEVQRVARGGG